MQTEPINKITNEKKDKAFKVVQTSLYQNFLWAYWFLGKKLAF